VNAHELSRISRPGASGVSCADSERPEESLSQLPWPLRALNIAGRAARSIGLPVLDLDPDALLRTACENRGLDDFGDPAFLAPYRLLFDAYEHDAHLTPFGRMGVRRDVLRLLENRLYVEDALKRHPEIGKGEIRAPIFVLGLPRTGTSILHELLAQDPAFRVPMTWETNVLFPPPERATYETDPRIALAEQHYSGLDQVLPEFKLIHRMGAQLPQECVALVSHEFASLVFHTSHDVARYQRWLDGADLGWAYRSHRRYLQYLQWKAPAERWVLKSPGHLWWPETLLEVYPDAKIVQTHRDPLRVVSSLAHLVAVLRGMSSDRIDRFAIGEDWAARLALGLNRTLAFRRARKLPDDRVFDIQFTEFVGREIPTVRRMYDHFGMTLSAEAEARMQRYLAANPKDGKGTHRYALSDAGLQPASERKRFADYQEHFRVHEEPVP
jgi:Sulfotransferase family